MRLLRLYINIDHVATVRQARRTDEPSPAEAARLCEAAGADGITLHLREDRRHIQDHDLLELSRSVTTVLNVELATAPDIAELVCRLRPHQATIVPERREEITTEGGLDVSRPDARLHRTIEQLKTAGIRTSLFIDPSADSVRASARLGVKAVELHTGRYAHSWREGDAALRELEQAARLARSEGLDVHAGHGLTYLNVQPVAAIEDIEELNIGHSIVSRAVMHGMVEAVTEMGRLIRTARRLP